MAETLSSLGFQAQKTGESHMEVGEYSRHGKGVCVIFVDGQNDPPHAVTAAYLLPTSEDGATWRIAGYVSAAGTGGKMKTATVEKSIGEDAPDVAFRLDMYLSDLGIKREELPGEKALSFF